MKFHPLKALAKYIDVDLDIDRRTASTRIQEHITISGTPFWFLISSCLITCIGLNINSAAIIIGAMLISPLMGPILGIGMGLAFENRSTTNEALKHTFIAVVASIAFSTLYFYISPFDDPTPEILTRISPTLLDLLVAIAAAFAGVVATISARFSATAAGVAVAIAVMPPLCATGFGIANQRWDIAGGAFYLFFINALAITYVAYLLLKKIRFLNTKEDPKKKPEPVLLLSRTAIYTALIIFAIPLAWTLYGMVNSYHFQRQLKNIVNEFKADADVVNWRVDSKGTTINALHIYVVEEPDQTKISNMNNRLKKLTPNTKIMIHTVAESSETRDFVAKFKNSPLYPALTNTALLRDMVIEEIENVNSKISEEKDKNIAAEAQALLGEPYRINIYSENDSNTDNLVIVIGKPQQHKISQQTQKSLEARIQKWIINRAPDTKQVKIFWDET